VVAHIKLAGVHAPDITRTTMDKMVVGDDVAARRILGPWELQEVATKMKEQLLRLKATGWDPDIFYNKVGP
jgi:hypothetical protein